MQELLSQAEEPIHFFILHVESQTPCDLIHTTRLLPNDGSGAGAQRRDRLFEFGKDALPARKGHDELQSKQQYGAQLQAA